MVHHYPLNQQNKHITTIPFQVKFISVIEVAATSTTNKIPEINDDEILEMTLMFERQQQQQQ